MTTLGPYEVHPFAAAFPLLDGDEFDELVADVKKNGLREPIVLSQDQRVLIDGRNRYLACEAAGADPVFERLGAHYSEPMILDLIVSKNLARRQLNAGQKAGLGVSYKEFYADAIKAEEIERKKSSGGPVAAAQRNGQSRAGTEPDPTQSSSNKSDSGRAANKAAAATGASATAIKQMNALKRDTPDLYQAVMADRISLDAAYKQWRNRQRSKPKPEPAPKPNPVMLDLRTHTGETVQYPKPQSKPTFNETTGDGISWAAWSWNPVTGCLHGCTYCYAREIASDSRYASAYPAGFTPLFHEERLGAPCNTSIPAKHTENPAYRRVFVCSMADLYGRWVPDEWIKQVHESMLTAPQWEYLVLTKFPDRYVGLDFPSTAWVGTSVDEQKRVRIAERAFRQIDGVKVKWLSLEPLLEPLEFTDLSMFDWVVIGAQTETRQPDGIKPAFQPPWEWVIDITKQAKDAGCKVHWKPNLHHGPGMVWPDQYPE